MSSVEESRSWSATGLSEYRFPDFPAFGVGSSSADVAACTVLTYGSVILETMAAVETTGIDAEVIDLRTLDPMGMDWDMIGQSLARTNRIMIAEETTRGTSIGAHLVKQIQERFFDDLDHEIVHISGTHSSPVVSKVLERAALAKREEIAAGLQQLVR